MRLTQATFRCLGMHVLGSNFRGPDRSVDVIWDYGWFSSELEALVANAGTMVARRKFNHGHFQVPRNIQNIELLVRRILKVNTGLLRTRPNTSDLGCIIICA
jgi:hypothetical protein